MGDFFVIHIMTFLFSSLEFFSIMHFFSLGGSTTRVMCIYFKLTGEEEHWNRNNSVSNMVQ